MVALQLSPTVKGVSRQRIRTRTVIATLGAVALAVFGAGADFLLPRSIIAGAAYIAAIGLLYFWRRREVLIIGAATVSGLILIVWALSLGVAGSPVSLFSSAVDATIIWAEALILMRLLKLEDQAAREAQRLETALWAGEIGVWEWDARSDRLQGDQTYFALFGMKDIGEISATELRARTHPQSRDDLEGEIGALKTSRWREEYAAEYRIEDMNGDMRWLASRGRVVDWTEDGAPARMFGIAMDITERKEIEAMRETMQRELVHRIKNLFGTVNSLISLSARSAGSVDELLAILHDRLGGLSRTHTMVSVDPGTGAAPIRDIFHAVLDPWLESGAQISLDGPRMLLNPAAAQALAMAMHEMATNAAKHGALSVPGGSVTVEWKRETGEDEAMLCLQWREQGGPEVEAPEGPHGFGTTLMSRLIEGQLRGGQNMDWAKDGLRAQFRLPLSAIGPEQKSDGAPNAA